MGYSEIDGYLKSFGVDVTKETSNVNSKWVYSKELLADAPDNILFEIAKELDIEHDFNQIAALAANESSFWIPSHFKLFISHLSSFKEKTAQLQTALRKYGISAFVAHEDIHPTKEWQIEIEKALFSMDALAAILVAGFSDSQWTDQEIGIALGRNVLVIPIIKEQTPYGFISKYQGLKTNGKTINQVAESIFVTIANHKSTKNIMANALVEQIFISEHIDTSITKLNLLKRFDSLDEVYLSKLRENVPNNDKLIKSVDFVNSLNNILQERDMPLLQGSSLIEDFEDDIPF